MVPSSIDICWYIKSLDIDNPISSGEKEAYPISTDIDCTTCSLICNEIFLMPDIVSICIVGLSIWLLSYRYFATHLMALPHI